MPTRRRTREHDRQTRITRERQQRAAINTETARQKALRLAVNYQPPPF